MKLSISGEAQQQHGVKGGTYFLQEDKINNKPYWIHQSGGNAIWWNDKYDYWMVGNFENLGKDFGNIAGPSKNDSPPNQITNGWQCYYDGTNDDETNWHDTNGVHFEDWTFKPSK